MTGTQVGDASTDAVRREAFRALLRGQSLAAGDIAVRADLPRSEVEEAIATLSNQGAIEVDPEGRVAGAHGLTERSTIHAVTGPDRTWHTWCALDAIGIPAALGLDVAVRTRCPTCGATIEIPVRAGSPPHQEPRVLWLPTGPCAHLIDDFCAAANVFCDADHLERWRARAGEPPGEALTLGAVAELGRSLWSDVTP
jgi:hypothetical protein